MLLKNPKFDLDPAKYDIDDYNRRTSPVYLESLNNTIGEHETISRNCTFDDIINSDEGLLQFDLGGYRLIVKKISGAKGFCGYRSVADAACEVQRQSEFETIVNSLRLEMIAKALEGMFEADKEAFMREKLIKKNVKSRWADDDLFAALTRSEKFKFKIQLIGRVNVDDHGKQTAQILMCDNGNTSFFGLDALITDEDTLTLINASGDHFDRVIDIERVSDSSTPTKKKPGSELKVISFRAFRFTIFVGFAKRRDDDETNARQIEMCSVSRQWYHRFKSVFQVEKNNFTRFY